MPEQINCPFCSELMEPDKNSDFFVCPGCKCEVWPDDEGFDEWRLEQKYKKGISKPGGGTAKMTTGKFILTVKDIQKMLGVSANVAYGLTKKKDFPAVRVGDKRIVIPRDKFLQWLDKRAGEAI